MIKENQLVEVMYDQGEPAGRGGAPRRTCW